ncbi:uncharacterized protein T551_01080 [Pneumocystis jirovecii RU7]|uniref:60S ribosomal protein L6 n=1 Tax=Pneumocystis jirovecii (strain RU7) TaxID=1408657 RepID=A0A0W4ZTW5_PNEJ7|nr:uncharacterized protein T551_01080 [Pneumocystis jirovecii RU7]KTW31819.1 hypothetical protein T551_01080 [Pneumocystis jirovecii RU7]
MVNPSLCHQLDNQKVVKKCKKVCKPPVLRSSLKPGVICIILAGRYRGKRVVFLKQLDDMILVTGPYKINGVPLRRVNPAFVIACSGIVIDVSAVDLTKYTKEYFSQNVRSLKRGKKSTTEDEFFGEKKTKQLDASRIADQKEVDSSILKSICEIPHLTKYLSSTFSLSKNDLPHMMKF